MRGNFTQISKFVQGLNFHNLFSISLCGFQYIEYNEKGIPLNWIEGRKPPEILPGNAKSLTQLDENELVKFIFSKKFYYF